MLRAGNILRFRQLRFSSTFFELFPKTFPDKSPTWKIDQAKLRKEYRKLQATVHPDMSQDIGDDKSSLLNKAYHVLKDPLTRSQYLLKLNRGIDLTKDETKQNITNSDPQLLMQIIDIHEELMEVTEEDDVRTIEKANKDRIKVIEDKLTTAFKNNDYDTAVKLTVELKYWSNLALAIKEWAPGKRLELHH